MSELEVAQEIIVFGSWAKLLHPPRIVQTPIFRILEIRSAWLWPVDNPFLGNKWLACITL